MPGLLSGELIFGEASSIIGRNFAFQNLQWVEFDNKNSLKHYENMQPKTANTNSPRAASEILWGVWGLIFGRAYFWRRLIIGILQYLGCLEELLTIRDSRAC